MEEKSEGADISPSEARVRSEAGDSAISASASWARTASRTDATVRAERYSSLPVTRTTWPRTCAAEGVRAMVRPTLSAGDDTELAVPDHHDHIAGDVGAPHARAGGGEGGQEVGGGVPVVVVRAHRDQCQPRAERGEPVEVLVAAAVVRHLEHVHPQPRQ